MAKKIVGFGEREKEHGFLERNIIGKYIVANNPYGGTATGKVIELDEGHLVFSPYIGAVKYKSGKEIMGFVNNKRYLEVISGMRYTKITEKELKNYCKSVNKATEKELKKEESKKRNQRIK
ncbi:MAG: hypothetical protein AABW50_04495 [Nanoarchaeota archaeon]